MSIASSAVRIGPAVVADHDDRHLAARHHPAQHLDQRARVADLEARGDHDDARLTRLEQIDRVVAAELETSTSTTPCGSGSASAVRKLGDPSGVGDDQDARR